MCSLHKCWSWSRFDYFTHCNWIAPLSFLNLWRLRSDDEWNTSIQTILASRQTRHIWGVFLKCGECYLLPCKWDVFAVCGFYSVVLTWYIKSTSSSLNILKGKTCFAWCLNVAYPHCQPRALTAAHFKLAGCEFLTHQRICL